MRIRKWEEADISTLVETERRCFSDPWTEQMFSDCLKLPVYHCFLAEEDEKIVGYSVLIAVCEDADVANIAVDPPFRGKGIAKALMETMHGQAKSSGATQCFLEVRVSNVAAIALYRAYGYETCGLRKGYYADGEDAFVMKKTL